MKPVVLGAARDGSARCRPGGYREARRGTGSGACRAAEVGSEEETVLRPPLRKLIPWHDEPNNEGGNHHRNEEGDKRVESALHHAECGTLNRRHVVDIEVPSELACI